MNNEKINEEQLRLYFRETSDLQKDLSLPIMARILSKKSPPMPVQMPGIILWGIVLLLFTTLSYAILQLDAQSFSFGNFTNMLNLHIPTLTVDPIVLIASFAIMVCVWVVVIFERKLLRG